MTGDRGVSKAGFDRLRGVMAGHVERGDLPGLVMLVSRHGEIQVDAMGRLAFEGSSMTRDSIFRITSMTKPVTAVAPAILVVGRRLQLRRSVRPMLSRLA